MAGVSQSKLEKSFDLWKKTTQVIKSKSCVKVDCVLSIETPKQLRSIKW